MALRYAILPHPPPSGAPSRREPLLQGAPFNIKSRFVSCADLWEQQAAPLQMNLVSIIKYRYSESFSIVLKCGRAMHAPYYLVSTKSLRLTRREIQMLGICPSGFDYSVSQVSHLRSR